MILCPVMPWLFHFSTRKRTAGSRFFPGICLQNGCKTRNELRIPGQNVDPRVFHCAPKGFVGTTSAVEERNIMGSLYVVCELGAEVGRVMLTTLHEGELTVSEVRRFQTELIRQKDSVHWNISKLYQEVI